MKHKDGELVEAEKEVKEVYEKCHFYKKGQTILSFATPNYHPPPHTLLKTNDVPVNYVVLIGCLG